MTRWLLTAAALGTLTGLALAAFGPHAAVGVAVCALAVIVFYGVQAARTDKRRARDKALHPSTWGRMDDMPQNAMRLRIGHDRITEGIIRDGEIVAERELPEVPERYGRFADLKPWPIGDDEVRS